MAASRWPRFSLRRLLVFLVLVAISVTTIYPLVFMVMSAVKGEPEFIDNPYGWPRSPTFHNVLSAWKYGKFGLYLGNSLVVVVAGVVLTHLGCPH